MLQRHADWFSILNVDPASRGQLHDVMEQTFESLQGMMHRMDIEALTAAVLSCQPNACSKSAPTVVPRQS